MKHKREEVTNQMIIDKCLEMETPEIYIHLFLDGYERLCNLEDVGLLKLEYMSFANQSINVYYKWVSRGERMYDTVVCAGYTFDKSTQNRVEGCCYHPNKIAKISGSNWRNEKVN